MISSSSGLRHASRKCAALLALSFTLAGGSSVARAADFAGGTLTVTRDADTVDCPDDAALGQATLSLGTPPVERADGVAVSVVFQRDAFGYGALVTTTGTHGGVREIRKPGPTCAPLAEAVSVVLAVIFDLAPPGGTAAAEVPPAPAPASPPAPAPGPPPKSAKVPPPRPPPAPPRARKWAFSLGFGAHGAVGYGLLGAAATAAAAGAVRPSLGRWELGAGVLGAPNRAVDYFDGAVYVSLVAGRLVGCGWLFPSSARPDLALCAGILVGRIRARGEGFDDDAPVVTDPWVAAEAGVAARFPVTPNIALRLGISLVVPSRRQRYTVAGVAGGGTAFSSSPAAGLLEGGPELRFP